jgi:integrase/recombinase XerD
MTDVAVFTQYGERLQRLNRAASTISSFRRASECLLAWLEREGIRLADLDAETLEVYFAQSPLAASTKHVHFHQLKAAIRYGMRRGLVLVDPTVDVRLERVAESEPVVIPNAELRGLLAACQTDVELVSLALPIFSGLRRFEVAKLRWEDVDLETGSIRLIGKGGKRRLVPIHPELRALLAELPRNGERVVAGPNGGASTSILEARLVEVRARAGSQARFHDLRRSVASSLYRNGVSGDTIDKIMGWAATNIRTRYYQHVANDVLQEAITRLYADDPVGL